MTDDAQRPVTLDEMKNRQELQILASRDLLTRAVNGAIKRTPDWIARQEGKIRVEEAILKLIEWAIAKKAARE